MIDRTQSRVGMYLVWQSCVINRGQKTKVEVLELAELCGQLTEAEARKGLRKRPTELLDVLL